MKMPKPVCVVGASILSPVAVIAGMIAITVIITGIAAVLGVNLRAFMEAYLPQWFRDWPLWVIVLLNIPMMWSVGVSLHAHCWKFWHGKRFGEQR
mgnify:CR=1 FL=1